MRCCRSRLILWTLLAGIALAIALLALMGFRAMIREFHRVAPGEEAAVAWIAVKGGTLAKEGPDRHVVTVHLGGADMCDSELARLLELPYLRELELDGTPITDAGLRILAPLENLEYLDVSYTQVTPEGIEEFVLRHPKVKMVGMAGIDDPSLCHTVEAPSDDDHVNKVPHGRVDERKTR